MEERPKHAKPARRNGPWTILSQHTAYENPWIRVDHNEVIQRDGARGIYGVVRFANRAIGILPIDDQGHVWLVGQHRFAFDKYSWELPGGGVPKEEDPLDGAMRELREETGLSAAHWHPMAVFDVSNCVSDEVAHCYLAHGLSAGEMEPDPSEELAVRRVAFGTLLDDIMAGTITDSLTIIMVLLAREMALRGRLPGPICELIMDDSDKLRTKGRDHG